MFENVLRTAVWSTERQLWRSRASVCVSPLGFSVPRTVLGHSEHLLNVGMSWIKCIDSAAMDLQKCHLQREERAKEVSLLLFRFILFAFCLGLYLVLLAACSWFWAQGSLLLVLKGTKVYIQFQGLNQGWMCARQSLNPCALFPALFQFRRGNGDSIWLLGKTNRYYMLIKLHSPQWTEKLR